MFQEFMPFCDQKQILEDPQLKERVQVNIQFMQSLYVFNQLWGDSAQG